MEMKKTLVAVGSVAAALVMVVSLAGTAQAAPGAGGRSGGISALVTAGTITAEQQAAFKAAVDVEKQVAGVTCEQAKTAALASLVAKGTITQSQADAIKAAKAAKRTSAAATSSMLVTPAS
jgi:competence protein ComGC